MKEYRVIKTKKYASPCGELLLGACDGRLCLCDWVSRRDAPRIGSRLKKHLKAEIREESTATTDEAARQLDEYFAGSRCEFDLPLLFAGTGFQRLVWQHLLDVPYGATLSYSRLAERCDLSESVRAVANAVGANALSVIVPCHRIIGADGRLTGYAGGIDAKRMLLSIESEVNEH